MLNFQFPEWAREALPWALAAFGVGFAGATSIHAVLYKRDPRSAVSWLSLMWLVPVLGPVLYLLFGINRIERKALSLRRRRHRIETVQPTLICTEDELRERLGPGHEGLVSLARVGERLLERPLLEGNRIEFYVNGEEAYPAMLAAIDSAERSVTLQVYIFDYDEVGARFADAIGRAVARGCQVRVLLDGVGAYRTLGDSLAAFRKGGAPAAVFLPLRLPIPPR
ncbi:MAG TPA: PLDc N-terminal domain-containing protein, partial [Planctomycetota bacterium]|nr:PLDc N-terminal domain-containing protein [Planctomycetota bacterium]